MSHQAPVPWSTGLFDCCDNCGNCCFTCFCPCVTFGRIAEIVDRGSSSCGTSGTLYALLRVATGYSCIYSWFYRTKLRKQYSLKKSPCNDCLVHCCCEVLALSQEYRELQRRGFDLTIGWQANMEMKGQPAITPPGVQAGMNR